MKKTSSVVNQEMLEAVIEHLQCLKTDDDYEEFLSALFSPRELRRICNRYQIAALLNEGWDYHSISHMLSVGVGTINRIAQQLELHRLKNAI